MARKKSSVRNPAETAAERGVSELARNRWDRHRWAWWQSNDGEVWKSLHHVAGSIHDRQKAQHREDWRHARLYAGMRPDLVTSFGAMGYVAAASSGPSRLPRFSFNVIESVIETAIARLAGNEVRPIYMTDGEEWDGQERAEMLTQFVDGCFYASDFRDVAVEAATDAAIFGTGFSHTFLEDGQIKSERVFPLEILVDEEDGLHRNPRQLIRHKPFSRDVVAFRHPKSAKEIEKAPNARTNILQGSISDNIMVVEAWHLPSGPGADDGRHCMIIDGADLLDEPWEPLEFPIEALRWKNALLGFWGRGIAEQLTGIQIEINRVVAFVQQSLSGASFKIFVEQASEIIDAHLNREIGGIIKYRGTPPTMFAPKVVSDEVIQWLLNLYGKAYELTGVSQMSAQGTKPAGVTSGVAIRSVDDLQDGRFARFGKRYETWHVKNAEQQIDCARRLYSSKKSISVATPGADFLRRIDWKDINLQRDEYIAQVFPESALPKTPAARRQTIQEYMEAKLLEPDEGRRLLRMPDLKAEQDLDDAPRNLVMKQISRMLKGRPQTPDPAQDFALAKVIVSKAICAAEVKEAPTERIQLLREFKDNLDGLLQVAAAAAAPPPMPAGPSGGPVLAKPPPPPTSDLLPMAAPPSA